jgi:hypothetical protein
MTDDQLVRDLVALGRAADVPPPSEDLAFVVLQRVAAAPPHRAWWTRQRRVATAVVTALLLALLAAPPVRAAVADLFGFAGVRVELGGSDDDTAPPPPTVTGSGLVSVDFPVYTLAALGEPDGTHVTDDGRIVSMSLRTDDGVVRLDQFDGELDYSMAKRAPEVTFVTVSGGDAMWFDDAHEVWLLGEGNAHAPRLAGHTLIWPVGGTTLRLEGDLDVDAAIEIAESAEPLG